MDEQRTGLDRPVLVPLQLATTLAVAQVSYLLVEQPIRKAKRFPMPVTFGTGAVATAAVAVLAVTVVPKPLGEYWLADEATAEAAAIEVSGGDLAPLTPLVATATDVAVADPAAPHHGRVGRWHERPEHTREHEHHRAGDDGTGEHDRAAAARPRAAGAHRGGRRLDRAAPRAPA